MRARRSRCRSRRSSRRSPPARTARPSTRPPSALGGSRSSRRRSISTLPEFAEFLAAATRDALTRAAAAERGRARRLHGAQPARVATSSKTIPYVAGLRAHGARRRGERSAWPTAPRARRGPLLGTFEAFGTPGAPRAWFLAYQSKGERPGAMARPDLDERDRRVRRGGRSQRVVVCPDRVHDRPHGDALRPRRRGGGARAATRTWSSCARRVPNDDDGVVDALGASWSAAAVALDGTAGASGKAPLRSGPTRQGAAGVKRVIIIGGGVAGLGAAYKIRRAADAGHDVDFMLVEKDDRLGGKLATEHRRRPATARPLRRRRRLGLVPDRQARGPPRRQAPRHLRRRDRHAATRTRRRSSSRTAGSSRCPTAS